MLVVQTYDDIAEWYDQWVHGDVRSDPLFIPVAGLVGDVAGARICDLACGQGRVARYLAEHGARVVGIDDSAGLLAIASQRERADPQSVMYLQDDAQHLAAVRNGSFDGVVCHMALMDIPDLGGTLRAVYRLLRLGGWFVFSVLHPCYHTPTSGEQTSQDGVLRRTVSSYWTEGFWRSKDRPGPPGKVGAYHRTLSTYLNTLTEVGLVVERICEPAASGSLAERRPIWREVPPILTVRCRKPGQQPMLPRTAQGGVVHSAPAVQSLA